MAIVTVKVNQAAIRRILDRTTTELHGWANKVLREKVEPVTPIDTGRLRKSARVSVQTDGSRNVNVWWWWQRGETDAYAWYVEIMRTLGKAPRTPGTIAPYAVPTITKAVREEIAKPIKRAFKS